MIPKLMLFDLDGTLLRSNGRLSDRTLAALKKAQSADSKIGFSTSRGNTNLENLVETVQPDVVVTNGGGSIFQNGKCIHTEIFSIEETRKILEKIYQVIGENAEITIDTLTDFFWNRKADKSECYAPDAKFSDMKDFKEAAMKICVQTQDSKKAEEIASVASSCDIIRFSDIPWHKFSNANATKGNALLYLAKRLSIPLEQTAAFGDDFSDISMIKAAGIGVAMNNAIDAVKASADEITLSCDEDGVAHWIEKHL